MRDLPTIKGRRPGIHTLPPRTDYVYRGDRPYEPRTREKTKVTESFDPSACGTNKGFNRHYRAGEEACEPCREARNAYDRTLKRKRTT